MKTSIDGAGRVVVPKAIRERLQLLAGAPVEIDEHDGVIEIVPIGVPIEVVMTPEGPVATSRDAGSDLTDDATRTTLERVPRVTAVGSSVVVAALVQWHEGHDVARREARGRFVPVHAYLESYAVLARLPPPRRLDARTAQELLSAWFPSSRILSPGADSAARYVERMSASGVAGGAAYDALVALTAAEHGEELCTRDRRAGPTYQRLGVAYRLVA